MVKKKNLFIRDLSIFLTKDTVGSKYRILIVTINHNRRERVKKKMSFLTGTHYLLSLLKKPIFLTPVILSVINTKMKKKENFYQRNNHR